MHTTFSSKADISLPLADWRQSNNANTEVQSASQRATPIRWLRDEIENVKDIFDTHIYALPKYLSLGCSSR
jgi:hypothetical protein